jgi:hypothetical protein
MAYYGLSPTFKGSSKGSFAFWTIGHHLSRNTTPVHSLHMLFPVTPVWCMCYSTELIFNSRRISVFLFLSNFVYPTLLLRNFISLAVILVLSLLQIVQASLPYVKIGLARVLWILIHVCSWNKEGLNI